MPDRDVQKGTVHEMQPRPGVGAIFLLELRSGFGQLLILVGGR
jgi:hypothetical protein